MINSSIYNIINNFKPSAVFIPFPDRHIDHRTVFDCAMVNTRPNKKFYPNILNIKLGSVNDCICHCYFVNILYYYIFKSIFF